jgi:hypothetical protein
MLRSICVNDILIYYQDKLSDTVAGYNIGDMLNMPFLMNVWPQTPHASSNIYEIMKDTAQKTEGSILWYYYNHRPNEADPIPNIPLILEAVQYYIEANRYKFEELFDLISKPTTLCIHVRNGDKGTEPEFISCIERESIKYECVILLVGLHIDQRYSTHIKSKKSLVDIIQPLLQKYTHMFVHIGDPDMHLGLMHLAANLLLHKGGFSCLGSIICSGTLYITDLFNYSSCINWQNKVNKPYTVCR